MAKAAGPLESGVASSRLTLHDLSSFPRNKSCSDYRAQHHCGRFWNCRNRLKIRTKPAFSRIVGIESCISIGKNETVGGGCGSVIRSAQCCEVRVYWCAK